MKYLILIFLICQTTPSLAQSSKLSIVWDMSAKDSSSHSAIFRQINNVLTAAPETQIEAVFHGNAIWALTKDSSLFQTQIQRDLKRGVVIAVCNNSMRRLKVDASQLLPGITIVPVAILELSRKQQEGWSYIKASH